MEKLKCSKNEVWNPFVVGSTHVLKVQAWQWLHSPQTAVCISSKVTFMMMDEGNKIDFNELVN